MKTKTAIAIILIALGVVILAYQGITYTTREKAVDLGPLQVTTEKTKTIPLPPIAGAIALVGGIVSLVWAKREADQERVSRDSVTGRECRAQAGMRSDSALERMARRALSCQGA